MTKETLPDYDVFVIGGGVNGCGIARDAAGRGYQVGLCEMNDLGSGTSSWSSKLIHGGVRYLEHYEFRLVREALSEREVLWSSAPHIIRHLRFVMPHHKAMRPAWFLRLGLFLYDHIGKRKLLPGTKSLNLRSAEVGKPLKDSFTKGFEYSDCFVDDNRLVILNAMDAAARGADIKTRTMCTEAKRDGGFWQITLQDQNSGKQETVSARLIVNASGPWVDKVLGNALGRNDAHNVRMVQGSHIVVPKMFTHDRAYIFQNEDERIIFAIPWQEKYTLIGTTDQDYEGDPSQVKITPVEIDYLCKSASEYFKKPVVEDDIVWTYSGVRPLYDDGATAAQEATRDYVLKAETPDDGGAPLINIFGGKITTFRKLAESMLEEIEGLIGAKKPAWTAGVNFPGGDFEPLNFDDEFSKFHTAYEFLAPGNAMRIFRAYGSLAYKVLKDAKSANDLGQFYGDEICQREVEYLVRNEWAQTADDILFRRTKLGVEISDADKEKLDKYCAELLSNG